MEILRNSGKSVRLLLLHCSRKGLFKPDVQISPVNQLGKNSFRSYKKRLPYEAVNTNVSKDVIVYEFDKSSKFKLVTILGILSGILCGSGAVYVLSYVSDPPPDDPEDDPWWKNNPIWRNKYRNAVFTICIVCGFIITSGAYFFSLRNVKSIWLLKGGQRATVSTYGPFASENRITAPVNEMSCDKARNNENRQLLLKIKGNYGFFAIDSNGKFPDPLLFDATVGMQRVVEDEKKK